ncbi:hypothetical protein HYH02_009150 [Chlamydomonas schloesseri]|uniref:Uncharacterized protein n=1 Tax=Chlamydomonas schloesseri TaxID=2026947 RepID=A0A835WBA0_9CHLO|nr:hypothetical protein HYH02_009150 [Chlamydomonas schloesseri]|eukprot:KAG2444212.1 hypothetical protein HYH02_009150 [Chlamydomonas schloesseri]
MLFLARHAIRLNLTLLWLRGHQAWSAWSQAFWLLRFLSALLLPHVLHVSLTAPMFTYLTRAAPLVAFLAAGPDSPLGRVNGYFLFGFGVVGDAFLSLTQPVLHMWPELAFNAFTLASMALLSRWHGASFPDLPARVDQQLLLRLALIACVHWYSLHRMRRSGRSRARAAAVAGVRGSSSGGGSGGSAAADAAAGSMGSARDASEAAAAAHNSDGVVAAAGGSAGEVCGKDRSGINAGGSDGGAELGELGVATEEDRALDAAMAALTGGPHHYACNPDGAGDTRLPRHGAAQPSPSATAASVTVTAARIHRYIAAVQLNAEGAAAAAADGDALSAAAVAIRAAQQCVAEADADPLPALPLVPPPYRSAMRRRTTRIKIPGCDPTQIGPGFTQRLQTLAAARGALLSGVYIREGCIELVLDEELWPARITDAAARAATAAAAATRPGDTHFGPDAGHLDSDHLLGDEVTRGAQLEAAAAMLVAPAAVPGSAWGSASRVHALSAGVQALLGEMEAELAAWERAWGVAEVISEEAEGGLEDAAGAEAASGSAGEGAQLQDLSRRGDSAPVGLGGDDRSWWNLASLVEALQLNSHGAEAEGGGGGGDGNIRGGRVSVDITAVTQQVAQMGRAAAAARGSDSAFDLHEPLVVELQPRALLLPAAAAGAAATAGGGSAAAGAGAAVEAWEDGAKPLARLRAVVSGRAPFQIAADVMNAGGAVSAANADGEGLAVEVLLRCCGEYLRTRVVTIPAPTLEEAGDAPPVTVYEIELLQRPQCPVDGGCVMLVELRHKEHLGHIIPVVLLSGDGPDANGGAAASGAAIVSELQALTARVYDMRAAGSRNCMSVGELDDLLLDVGTCLGAAPTAGVSTAAAAAATTTTDTTTEADAVPRRRLQLELAAGLLRYVDTSAMLPATARRLRAYLASAIDDLRRSRPPTAAAAAAAAPLSSSVQDAVRAGDVAAGAGNLGEGASASAAPPAGAAAAGAAMSAGPATAAALQRPQFFDAVKEALGLRSRGPGPEAADEEAAYHAYAQPLIFAQGHVIQAVEALSLLALLFRARHDLLSRGNLTTLSGCCTGTATSLAWLLLPRPAWVRLVNALKIPCYVMYMLSKLMIGCLSFPTPPGLIPYQLGPAMLVMEGVLLPGSNLLPLPTALLITLVKWPLAIAMMLGSHATDSLLTAALVTFRVVLLALATTALCHAYLRYSFRVECWRRRQAAVAVGGANGAAGLDMLLGSRGSGADAAVWSKEKVE